MDMRKFSKTSTALNPSVKNKIKRGFEAEDSELPAYQILELVLRELYKGLE
jgi:hypothetical protein